MMGQTFEIGDYSAATRQEATGDLHNSFVELILSAWLAMAMTDDGE